MNTLSIQISTHTRDMLDQLSKDSGKAESEILEDALQLYSDREFWKNTDAAYWRLRQDNAQWNDELDERKLWEMTLADGVTTNGICIHPDHFLLKRKRH